MLETNILAKLKGFIHNQLDLPFTFEGCESNPKKEAVRLRKCYTSALRYLDTPDIEEEKGLTSAGAQVKGRHKRPAFRITEREEEDVSEEYVQVSGDGAPAGSAIILVTSLDGRYLAPQKGYVIADRNGNWQHPRCHLLHIGRHRLVYALAVNLRYEDKVRELLHQKGKIPIDKSMDEFAKVLKAEKIPFQLSPKKRLIRLA